MKSNFRRFAIVCLLAALAPIVMAEVINTKVLQRAPKNYVSPQQRILAASDAPAVKPMTPLGDPIQPSSLPETKKPAKK